MVVCVFLLALLVATASADGHNDDKIAAKLGSNVEYRPGRYELIANMISLQTLLTNPDLFQIHVWKVAGISMRPNPSLRQRDTLHAVNGRMLHAAHPSSPKH